MVRSRVFTAMDRDCAITRIIVGAETLVEAPMLGGTLIVAELFMDQG